MLSKSHAMPYTFVMPTCNIYIYICTLLQSRLSENGTCIIQWDSYQDYSIFHRYKTWLELPGTVMTCAFWDNVDKLWFAANNTMCCSEWRCWTASNCFLNKFISYLLKDWVTGILIFDDIGKILRSFHSNSSKTWLYSYARDTGFVTRFV